MTVERLENNYFPKNNNLFLNTERSKEIIGLTSKILFLKTAPKQGSRMPTGRWLCSRGPSPQTSGTFTAGSAATSTWEPGRHACLRALGVGGSAASRGSSSSGGGSSSTLSWSCGHSPPSECVETHSHPHQLQTERREGMQVTSALAPWRTLVLGERRMYSVKEEISQLKQL